MRDSESDWEDESDSTPSSLPIPKDDRLEKSDRRSKRDYSKSSGEPPEIIPIQMTAEEQDVYALMGITPLVLFDGEVKNPKSAVISVYEPGNTPEIPSVSTPAAPKLVNLVEKTPIPVDESDDFVESDESDDFVDESDDFDESNESSFDNDTSNSEESNVSISTTVSTTRRRRRRSSATD
jgi:ribonuclease E